jgi:hypothetical protein
MSGEATDPRIAHLIETTENNVLRWVPGPVPGHDGTTHSAPVAQQMYALSERYSSARASYEHAELPSEYFVALVTIQGSRTAYSLRVYSPEGRDIGGIDVSDPKLAALGRAVTGNIEQQLARVRHEVAFG